MTGRSRTKNQKISKLLFLIASFAFLRFGVGALMADAPPAPENSILKSGVFETVDPLQSLPKNQEFFLIPVGPREEAVMNPQEAAEQARRCVDLHREAVARCDRDLDDGLDGPAYEEYENCLFFAQQDFLQCTKSLRVRRQPISAPSH